MSELQVSQKPTLGLLLSNPQTEDLSQIDREKIKFPKINTKLKKTHFTKYHSSFISAKSCDIISKSEPNQNISYQFQINNVKTSEKSKQGKIKQKRNFQANQKVWKINEKYDKSFSVRSPQRLSQSRILFQSELQQTPNRNKILYSPPKNERDSSSEGVKFALLTELRDLNISPIHHSENQKQQLKNLKKSQSINEQIQRSNNMISLIENNYKKGFFNDHVNQQKKFNQLQQKLGLFAYLKRDFVTKKQTLTPEKVVEYFKRPSNKKLEAKISFEARSFLKNKLHNDYHSHNQVEKLRGDLSQRAIQEQIKCKNKAFHKQYRKKYNIPYLSYLSLPKHLKVKVLQSLTGEPKQKLKK